MSMYNTKRIRNVSIIAHVDHGKTALSESLGHFYTDVGDEKDLGITIKSASVTLQFSRVEMNEQYSRKTLLKRYLSVHIF